MVALIKKVFPSSLKNKIKSINRERKLGVAMKRLTAAVESGGAPESDILTELGRAWGEDGYRAVGGYLEEVARFARETRGPVLEIGSGLTTLILGALVARRGIPVWTLEHHPEYFSRTEETLKSLGLANIHLTFAPLRDYGDFCWYDPPLDALPRDFSLVIADGPPGDVKGGRFGLLPILRSHFAPGVIVLLDDAERAREKAVLEKWEKEYGLSQQLRSRNGKAWAICSF
jgi:predicted O-methyltransferase YrrM